MSSKLFLVYYAVQKVVLTFEDISWVIHDLLTLHKVVLTFYSVYEIRKCDHSNESYRAVLSCGTVYHAVQGGCNF